MGRRGHMEVASNKLKSKDPKPDAPCAGEAAQAVATCGRVHKRQGGEEAERQRAGRQRAGSKGQEGKEGKEAGSSATCAGGAGQAVATCGRVELERWGRGARKSTGKSARHGGQGGATEKRRHWRVARLRSLRLRARPATADLRHGVPLLTESLAGGKQAEPARADLRHGMLLLTDKTGCRFLKTGATTAEAQARRPAHKSTGRSARHCGQGGASEKRRHWRVARLRSCGFGHGPPRRIFDMPCPY